MYVGRYGHWPQIPSARGPGLVKISNVLSLSRAGSSRVVSPNNVVNRKYFLSSTNVIA